MVVTTSAARYVDLLNRLEGTRRIGVALGLERTREALALLGNPERRAVTVQIAGTNGKGSTAAMTEAVLRAAGMRTGLYTSPHLSRFTERIRIDGREVSGDHLAELDEAIVATGVPLTYFEVATVLAFLAFADAGVEAVVLETGLGGRLDATTVCRPVATAITSIDFDHTEILGATLAEIAREKAGIAKRGVPLFLGPVPPEAETEIAAVARTVGAPLWRLGQDFAASPAAAALASSHHVSNAALAGALGRSVAAGLTGSHQVSNAALAVALARSVANARTRALTEADVATGLVSVEWPGRLESIGDSVLLDCAHNPQGAAALAVALDTLPRRRRALVISVVGGKAAGVMLATLAPHFDEIFVTRSGNDRALDPEVLASVARASVPARIKVTAIADPLRALSVAQASVGEGAGPSGLVVVAGSMFLVGDLRAALLGEARDPLPTSDPLSR